MIVVSNTTPIISLSSVNCLDLLEAKELNADFVMIDENLGYKIANHAGLTAIRTLSLLLKAKEKGYISELKPLLDEMIAKGRWYSNNVYRVFLIQAGEL